MDIKTLPVGLLETNCYIVSCGETAVIDPGGDFESIVDALDGAPVKYIILTHSHFDHCLAAANLKKTTGAALVIHASDAVSIDSADGSLYSLYARGQAFDSCKADILCNDGDVLTLGDSRITVIHTPGHSPGSSCFLINGAMFSGDTLFEDDCGRCDLPGGSYPTMLKSLKRLHDIEGDYTVFPGHGPATTLERERKVNVNMREAL